MFRSALLAMLAAIALPAFVAAQDASFATATYVELLPSAKSKGVGLMRAYRDASRRDAGVIRLDIAQRIDRTNQFIILALWKDKAAFDAHAASAHAKRFKDQLEPLYGSPNDERQHGVMTAAAMKLVPRRAVIVVTHVDVPLPQKDPAIALLQELATASRRESDNLRFDVWQQTSRPNHFTVVETWTGQKGQGLHAEAAHTREFRTKLTPMLGALYDDRLYRPIP